MSGSPVFPNKPVLAVVGMPAWSSEMPFHAVAMVSAIARAADWESRVHDLNIEFYHRTSADERARLFDNAVADIAIAGTAWDTHRAWLEDRLARILEDGPTIIGFSVNRNTDHFSVQAARVIRRLAPDVVILFGGVNCFPGEFGAKYVEQGICDLLCQGEAEVALREFLREYRRTGSLFTDIPGFIYRRDGRVINTGPVVLPDMKKDVVHADFSGFDLSLYPDRGRLPFMLSRGCPYRCQFCSETVNFRRFRMRDAAEAFGEVRRMAELAAGYAPNFSLHLADSIMNANVGELARFADLIIESGLRLDWGGQAHIHPRMTFDILLKLRLSGLSSFFWGIESGSQDVVDLMEKRYRVSDARRIIRDCSRLGIAQVIPILLGFPGEQAHHVVETIAFVLEFRSYPKVKILPPYRVVATANSPLATNPERYRLNIDSPASWSTEDGGNTPEVRALRRFFAWNALERREEGDDIVDFDSFAALDFASPVVAREYFDLLDGIFRTMGEPEWTEILPVAAGGLGDWLNADRREISHRDLARAAVRALDRFDAWVLSRPEARDIPPEFPVVDGRKLTRRTEVRGWVEFAHVRGDDLVIIGWVSEIAHPGRPLEIVVFDGDRIAARQSTSITRGDLVDSDGRSLGPAGFEMRIRRRAISGRPSLFAVTADGAFCRLDLNVPGCLPLLHDVESPVASAPPEPEAGSTAAAKTAALESFAAFTRGEGMPEWPLEIFLELSNLCDLKCAMCPTFSALSPHRLRAIKEADRGFMDTEKAGECLRSLLRHALTVHCFGYGEATIHPRFREAIDYLSRFEVMIDFFTNGMHLAEVAEFLVERKVQKVTVSFSGATREEYENVYLGGDFRRVLAGMRSLTEAKARAGSLYPLIEVNSLSFRHHVERLEEFVDLMAAHGVARVYLKPLQEHGEAINALAGHAVVVRPEIEGAIIERARERARAAGMDLVVLPLDTAATPEEYEAIQARRRAPVEAQGKPYSFVPVESFAELSRSVVPLRPLGDADPQARLDLDRDDVDYLRLALDIEPGGAETTGGGAFHCMEPFTTFYVRRGGDVKPCCFADNAAPSLGLVGRHDGEEIWRGNGFAGIREAILSGLYPKAQCHFCLKHAVGPRRHFVDGLAAAYSDWHGVVHDSEGLPPLVLPDNAGIVGRIMECNPALLTGNRFQGGLTVLRGRADLQEDLRRSNRWAKLETLRAALAASTAGDIVRVEGNIDVVTRDHVEGWVWTPLLPEYRFDVSVWLGDRLLASGNAATYRDDLERAGKGDGRYHYKLFFTRPLPPEADLYAVEVRVEGAETVLRRSAECR